MQQNGDLRAVVPALLGVLLLAAAARFAVLPLATTDGGDSVYRVWKTLDWLDDPHLITHGVWGPLHFYLIGLSIKLWPDPVVAPIALNLMFSIATSVLIYVFTRIVFGGHWSALIVAATYAFYPVAIRNGVSVRAETLFVVFLLLAMIFVALARRPQGAAWQAALGGLALTLAAMLRYEGWMLVPFFTLLLWRTPRLAAVFLTLAMVHPVFWMVGNYVEHGDPLYSVHWSTSWEQESMGRLDIPFSTLLLTALRYPTIVVKGMSTPIGILAGVGMIIALLVERREREWLVPMAGLMLLLAWSILRGALVPKLNYTLTLGTMMYPFSAIVWQRIGVEQWSPVRLAGLAGGLALAILLAACRPCLETVGAGFLLSLSPVPTIENQTTALDLPPIIDRHMPADGALINDFYGWGASPYVALLTRLEPDRVFHVSGAPNKPVNVDGLRRMVARYPDGVVVLREGSRLARSLGSWADGAVRLDGVTLSLDPVERVAWPLPEDPHGELVISRYRTITPVAADPAAGGGSN